MVEVEKLKKFQGNLRELKAQLNQRLSEVLSAIDNNYSASLETINNCIKRIDIVISIIESPKVPQDQYYDCINPISNNSTYIEIPTIPQQFDMKLIKSLQLSKLQGFFSLPNIKTNECTHSFHDYHRSSCKELHCFKCIKEQLKKENNIEKIKKYLDGFRSSGLDEEEGKVEMDFKCSHGKVFTYRECYLIEHIIS